jgi:hypothetical protein
MRTLILLACLSAPATAQSFNIDVGQNLIIYPVPASTYAGAASQPGVWNASISPYSTALVNLSGAATGVTTSSNQSSSYSYFPSTLTGDDYNLMVDIQNLPTLGGPWTWTFNGLQNGNYVVYTYAWAPENNGHITRVTVPGSMDPAQNVGGAWSGGAYVLGVTHAVHNLSVTTSSFTVQVEGVGASGGVNAFQLVFTGGPSAGTPFCFGDGTGLACPCANSGSAGNGCANSVSATGGNLSSTGSASIGADTLVLTSINVPTGPGLFFQGTTQFGGGNGIAFGDGLLCAGGSIIRLGVVFASGGSAAYPGGTTPGPISVGGLNAPGNVRTYQEWYRDGNTGFCTASTFNLTNGVQVTWQP